MSADNHLSPAAYLTPTEALGLVIRSLTTHLISHPSDAVLLRSLRSLVKDYRAHESAPALTELQTLRKEVAELRTMISAATAASNYTGRELRTPGRLG